MNIYMYGFAVAFASADVARLTGRPSLLCLRHEHTFFTMVRKEKGKRKGEEILIRTISIKH